MMATAEQLLEWARTQLGVTELPPGSNHVRYWDDVDMATLQGAPWCAAFVLAGLVATGVVPVTRSVWVASIVADYKAAGRLFPVAAAVAGDQILYRIGNGHTGVLESIDLVARTVTCIEGNTTPGVVGVQDNGGGVYRRTRAWSLVVGAGRPTFTHSRTPGPIRHSEVADMAMIVIDPKGPDDQGRDSHWEVTPEGDVLNWNAARPLRSLREVVAFHPLIVAAVLDPSGDGVVMFGDDAHQDENGHWVRSTFKILVT